MVICHTAWNQTTLRTTVMMMEALMQLLLTTVSALGCDSPENCVNLTCHLEQATPICTHGCVAGYAGNLCKEYCFHKCVACERNDPERCTNCDKGFFGNRCESQCPNCLNSSCHINGSCVEGCKSSWGSTCTKTCPDDCKEECDQYSGVCITDTTVTFRTPSQVEQASTSTQKTSSDCDHCTTNRPSQRTADSITSQGLDLTIILSVTVTLMVLAIFAGTILCIFRIGDTLEMDVCQMRLLLMFLLASSAPSFARSAVTTSSPTVTPETEIVAPYRTTSFVAIPRMSSVVISDTPTSTPTSTSKRSISSVVETTSIQGMSSAVTPTPNQTMFSTETSVSNRTTSSFVTTTSIPEIPSTVRTATPTPAPTTFSLANTTKSTTPDTFGLCEEKSEREIIMSYCIGKSDESGMCLRGCTGGFHGPACNKACPENCAGACSQSTGQCLTGCKPNWFTANCCRSCSRNCIDDVCDSNNGECIKGCKDGFYGLGCNISCSGNCSEGRCDVYGGCRCKKGVSEEHCYINCDDCIDEDCTVVDGGQVKCRKGCKEGRTGSLCKELADCDGSFGCSPQGKGRKRRATQNCHEEDGNGRCLCCEERWRGPFCDIECPACRYSYRHNCTLACSGGFFGVECHLPCPADCSRATNGRSRCNGDGVCDSGCLQGYYGFVCQHTCPTSCLARTCFMNNGSCTDECIPGAWGPRCDRECGHCQNSTCERDGTCTCTRGYYGPRCQDRCSDHCQSGNCSINSDGNHICIGECQPSYTGADCLSRCPRDCYNSYCDKVTGACDDDQQVGASTGEDHDNTAIIVGATCGTIAAVGVFLIVFCCLRKRKKKPFDIDIGHIACCYGNVNATNEHHSRPEMKMTGPSGSNNLPAPRNVGRSVPPYAPCRDGLPPPYELLPYEPPPCVPPPYDDITVFFYVKQRAESLDPTDN